MSTEHHILVPLAPGFEETEAVAVIDVLRRADLRVSAVALGDRRVEGSHGIVIEADCGWDEAELDSVTAVALPGGMPGTRHLAADGRLLELIRRLDAESRPVAAVCAAPLVLAAAGVLRTPATSHPGVADELALTDYSEDRVCSNGHQMTSRGPGTALEWALALVAELVSPERAAELRSAMLVR